MVNWIYAHLGDIVVLAILGLIIFAVTSSMVRGKKKGKLCGSCSGCAGAGCCQKL